MAELRVDGSGAAASFLQHLLGLSLQRCGGREGAGPARTFGLWVLVTNWGVSGLVPPACPCRYGGSGQPRQQCPKSRSACHELHAPAWPPGPLAGKTALIGNGAVLGVDAARHPSFPPHVVWRFPESSPRQPSVSDEQMHEGRTSSLCQSA